MMSAGPATLASRVGRWLAVGPAFLYMYVTALYLTLPDVRPLADAPPKTTAFIELRAREAKAEHRIVEREQRWVPFDAISPSLKRAVLVAEDSAFYEHDGLDYEEMRKSMALNWERGDFSRALYERTFAEMADARIVDVACGHLIPMERPDLVAREVLSLPRRLW